MSSSTPSLLSDGSTYRPPEYHGPVAIFDLDRTILPGSSIVVLARALVREGLLPRRMLATAAVRNVCFRRRGASDTTVARLVSELLLLVEGLPVLDLAAMLDELRRDLIAASRPELRRRILRHRASGDRCVVLTASPVQLAQLVAEGLGAHDGVGTRPEIRDGIFTGRLVGPVCYGSDKIAALDGAGLHPAWAASSAYSDSVSDLPLLRAVAHPVAVTPDRALRRVAEMQHWPILDIGRRPRLTRVHGISSP